MSGAIESGLVTGEHGSFGSRVWRRWFGSHESVLGWTLLVLVGVFTWRNPAFFSWGNAADLINSHCFLALLAVGVFVVLVSGGIDISFTATAAVSQYLTVLWVVQPGGHPWLAGLAVSAFGVLLGLVNASLIHGLRAPSIIITLATLNVYQGLLIGLSGGRWVYELPAWFQELGAWQWRWRPEATQGGLTVGALVLIGVVLVLGVVLRWSVLGRSWYALGGGEVAARRIGLKVFRVRSWAYGLLGLLAGWAGLINTLQVQVASPTAILGRELDVFAAVVLGGAGLSGGTGTLHGTMLGVALIAVLSNGLTLMRVPAIWTRMILGLILIMSVVMAAWRQRSGRGQRRAGEIPA